MDSPFDAYGFIDAFEIEKNPDIFSGSCWVIKGTRVPVETFMACLEEKIQEQLKTKDHLNRK